MHSKHPPAKLPLTTDLHIFHALRVQVIRTQPPATADIISSRMCDTTTLLAIRRKTSPIPIGRSPGFLSNGINLHASNASNDDDRSSIVQSFFITSANVLPNRLSCYQIDVISRSSSSHLHHDQRVLLHL